MFPLLDVPPQLFFHFAVDVTRTSEPPMSDVRRVTRQRALRKPTTAGAKSIPSFAAAERAASSSTYTRPAARPCFTSEIPTVFGVFVGRGGLDVRVCVCVFWGGGGEGRG